MAIDYSNLTRRGWVKQGDLLEFGPQATQLKLNRQMANSDEILVEVTSKIVDIDDVTRTAIIATIDMCAFIQSVDGEIVNARELIVARVMNEMKGEVK